jgi:hypothetical protein
VDGFEESIIKDAISAQEGGHKVIASLFRVLSLSDERKLRK